MTKDKTNRGGDFVQMQDARISAVRKISEDFRNVFENATLDGDSGLKPMGDIPGLKDLAITLERSQEHVYKLVKKLYKARLGAKILLSDVGLSEDGEDVVYKNMLLHPDNPGYTGIVTIPKFNKD